MCRACAHVGRRSAPQMLHLDTTVPTATDLHQRALHLGARVLLDRSDGVDEPLFAYADPRAAPILQVIAF